MYKNVRIPIYITYTYLHIPDRRKIIVLDSPEDKIAVKKAIKVVPIAQEIYDMEESQIEDVVLKLYDIEQITLGESFKIAISLHVSGHYNTIFTSFSV